MKFNNVCGSAIFGPEQQLDVHQAPPGLWQRVAVVCGWDSVERARKRWPDAAVVGSCRTLGGLDLVLRNLLANDQIRVVVWDGPDLSADSATITAWSEFWFQDGPGPVLAADVAEHVHLIRGARLPGRDEAAVRRAVGEDVNKWLRERGDHLAAAPVQPHLGITGNGGRGGHRPVYEDDFLFNTALTPVEEKYAKEKYGSGDAPAQIIPEALPEGIPDEDRPGGRIVLLPPPPVATAAAPHGDPGERVVGDLLSDVWPGVLHAAMSFGRTVPTQYGPTRELLSLVAVIRKPEESINELEDETVSCPACVKRYAEAVAGDCRVVRAAFSIGQGPPYRVWQLEHSRQPRTDPETGETFGLSWGPVGSCHATEAEANDALPSFGRRLYPLDCKCSGRGFIYEPHGVLGFTFEAAMKSYADDLTGRTKPVNSSYGYGYRMYGFPGEDWCRRTGETAAYSPFVDLVRCVKCGEESALSMGSPSADRREKCGHCGWAGNYDQFELVKKLLTEAPGSRAAYLTPWKAEVDAGLETGRPCLTGVQFRAVPVESKTGTMSDVDLAFAELEEVLDTPFDEIDVSPAAMRKLGRDMKAAVRHEAKMSAFADVGIDAKTVYRPSLVAQHRALVVKLARATDENEQEQLLAEGDDLWERMTDEERKIVRADARVANLKKMRDLDDLTAAAPDEGTSVLAVGGDPWLDQPLTPKETATVKEGLRGETYALDTVLDTLAVGEPASGNPDHDEAERTIEKLLADKAAGQTLDVDAVAKSLKHLSPLSAGYVLRHVFDLTMADAVHRAKIARDDEP